MVQYFLCLMLANKPITKSFNASIVDKKVDNAHYGSCWAEHHEESPELSREPNERPIRFHEMVEEKTRDPRR